MAVFRIDDQKAIREVGRILVQLDRHSHGEGRVRELRNELRLALESKEREKIKQCLDYLLRADTSLGNANKEKLIVYLAILEKGDEDTQESLQLPLPLGGSDSTGERPEHMKEALRVVLLGVFSLALTAVGVFLEINRLLALGSLGLLLCVISGFLLLKEV